VAHDARQEGLAKVSQAPAASSREFAADLAVRLNDVVPAGFTVTSDGQTVVMHHNGQRLGSTNMAEIIAASENPDDVPGNMEAGSRAILNTVQDWIADESTEPWPGISDMPSPEAQVVGGRLVMWFGAQDRPVLELRPLKLR
jgi:hypothetical protein